MAGEPDFAKFDMDIYVAPRAIDPEANITGGNGQLLTGWINASHTSNLTMYFEPSTLPAPFPLVIISSLVSLVCACIGWKTAVKTWATPGRRVRMNPRVASMPYGERVRLNYAAYKRGGENPSLIVEEVPLRPLAGPGAGYPGHEDEDEHEATVPFTDARWASTLVTEDESLTIEEEQQGRKRRDGEVHRAMDFADVRADAEMQAEKERRLREKDSRDREIHQAMLDGDLDSVPRDQLPPIMRLPERGGIDDPDDIHYVPPWTRVVIYCTATFSCIRALVAFGTEMAVVATDGTHAAPSSLFLLLLTLQVFISNRAVPLWMTLLLVLCSALVAAVFMMSIWDWSGSRYSQLYIEGGRCPVYASDCSSQAHQWTNLGCGAVLPYEPIPGHSSYNNPNWGQPFYPPYGTQGDINSGVGVLWIIESVVGGCGTFWAVPTVLATLWEASKLVRGILSWKELFHPVPERFLVSPPPPAEPKPGQRRKCPRLGWAAAVGCITIFCIMGSFVVVILSIAGHVAAETITHHAGYIDSFGPPVDTNVTLDSQGYVNATFYGGNATSWSDCFSVPTPTSSNGFFGQWLIHNEHVAFRLISLV